MSCHFFLVTNLCLTENGGCDINANCTMKGPNMRSCECKDGYVGDGETCTGMNSVNIAWHCQT